MRVGIHAGSSSADEVAASCRDAGVNEIFLGAGSVPGAADRGYMTSDDFKPRGDVFISRLEELLAERGVSVRHYRKPTFTKPAPLDLRRQIAAECGAVIEALAD